MRGAVGAAGESLRSTPKGGHTRNAKGGVLPPPPWLHEPEGEAKV